MRRFGLPFATLVVFLCAMLPFALNQGKFARLIWFGDDIALLAEYQQQGLWPWIFTNFAENFTPIFKLFWLAAKNLVAGKYIGMLGILWLTHAGIYALLAALLIRLGGSVFGVLFVVVAGAVSHAFFETLGWATQWSAVLSLFFFVSGLHIIESLKLGRNRWLYLLGLFLAAACTAFSFSRGVLSCAIMFAYLLLNWKKVPRVSFILVALPAFVSVFMIMAGSGGNHQGVFALKFEQAQQILLFFVYFLGANPFYRFFYEDGHPALLITVLLLLVKLVLWSSCFLWFYSRKIELSRLVLAMILFDLGNATLLALGRYHTGFQFALSSRYQYESTFCLMPMLLLFTDRVQGYWRSLVFFTLLLSVIYSIYSWRGALHSWTEWRGSEGRRFLRGDPSAQQWLGVPRSFMSNEDAMRIFTDQKLS